jgi:large repetitive protein
MSKLTRSSLVVACTAFTLTSCNCDPTPVNLVVCEFSAQTRLGTSIDFGTADVNDETREASVVLKNTGTAQLRDFSFSFQGNADQYEVVVDDPFTVSAGDEDDFVVRFRPTQATTLPSTLVISHPSVGDECGVVSVALVGVGTVPAVLDGGNPDAGPPPPDAGPAVDAGFVTEPDGGVLLTPTTEWVAYGGFEEARTDFALVSQPDGTLLAIGGYGEDGRALDSIEQFDPIEGRARILTRMAVARAAPAAVRIQDGRVVIVGGRSGDPVGVALRSVEVLDVAAATVSCPAPQGACTEADNDVGALAEGRFGAVATSSGNDVIVVFGQTLTGGEAVVSDGGVVIRLAAQITSVPLDGVLAGGRTRIGVATATNGDLLLVGGLLANGAVSPEVYQVDVSGPTLGLAATLPTGRRDAGVALLSNGDALVVGGVLGSGALTADALTLVNALGGAAVVEPVTVALQPRVRPQVITLADDVVMIAGGLAGNDVGLADTASLLPRVDAEVLVPVGASWLRLSPANDLAQGRIDGRAARYGDDQDQIVFLGGVSMSPRRTPHPHAESYDLSDNRFFSFGLMGAGTALAAAAYPGSGAALLSLGGIDPHSGRVSTTVRAFDAEHGVFEILGALGTPRFGATATSIAADVIIVAGGSDDTGAVLSSLSVFTTTDGIDRPLPVNLRRARSQHTATLLPPDSPLGEFIILLCGGIGAGGEPLDTCELVTPPANPRAPVTFNTAQTELVSTRMATGRVGHSATLLDSGEVLLLGGGDIENDLVRADVFVPTLGDPHLAATGSPDKARRGHAAVLLGGGRVLVVGGEVFQGGIGPTRSAELYIRALDTFLPLEDMEQPRAQPAAFLLADGNVFIAGGARGLTSTDVPFASNKECELYVPGPDGSGPFEFIDVPLSYGRSDLLFTDVFGRPVVAVGSHRDGVLISGDERRTPQHFVDVLRERE